MSSDEVRIIVLTGRRRAWATKPRTNSPKPDTA